MSDNTDDKKPLESTPVFKFPSPPPSVEAPSTSTPSPQDAPRGDALALTEQQKKALAWALGLAAVESKKELIETPGAADAAEVAAHRAQLINTVRMQRRQQVNVAVRASLRGAGWGFFLAVIKIGISWLIARRSEDRR